MLIKLVEAVSISYWMNELVVDLNDIGKYMRLNSVTITGLVQKIQNHLLVTVSFDDLITLLILKT